MATNAAFIDAILGLHCTDGLLFGFIDQHTGRARSGTHVCTECLSCDVIDHVFCVCPRAQKLL